MQRRAHILRRVIHHHKLIVRVGLPHILQDSHDAIGSRDQVRIAVFENGNTDGVLPIDAGEALHLRVLPDHLGYRGNRDLPTARRIVSWVSVGYNLKQGETYGMIKFGSSTELIVPKNVEIVVKKGDKVVGGITVVGRVKA